MPPRFFESFVMEGLRVHLIESGRLVCSIKVPQRLLVRACFNNPLLSSELMQS
uniref:Uncharacterized protein n=1 Tax=Rhizophora mucronata TaxID=61149 RepID=A0A2P2IYH6_RHIMU